MKFSEALGILEMEPSEDLDDGLVRAYRKAMKKYHPDVTELDLDFALEMSKLVNEAYAFLAANVGKWSLHDKGETNVASWMVDVYNKIRHIPHITIVRAGVWLWVTVDGPPEFSNLSSDTFESRLAKKRGLSEFRKGVGAQLKEAGFSYAPNKQKWSWHCVDQGPRKRWKRHSWSWDRITQTFTTDELETAPRTAVA
jgi:hypothetical protein